jgi:hypothetical protein
MLYSIVIEYKEDTYVIQHVSDDPDNAIYDGLKNYGFDKIRILNEEQFSELILDIENEKRLCVPVNDLSGVWVNTFLVEDHLVQIHAIETYQNI